MLQTTKDLTPLRPVCPLTNTSINSNIHPLFSSSFVNCEDTTPIFLYTIPANAKFGIRESFARFDRIQAVHHVNLQPMNVKLHEDCSLLFFELLRYYLTGEIDEDVAEIKKELIKVLKPK